MNGEKYQAGRFAILGGPSEMPWNFDRLYRYQKYIILLIYLK